MIITLTQQIPRQIRYMTLSMSTQNRFMTPLIEGACMTRLI